MKTLRVASFGIRGYVGESLTPKVVIDYASAFATFVDGGRVLIGRDTRYSSPMLYSALVSGLLSAGCEVLDFGVCPTPILQFSVGPFKAAGAVSISGGHNAMGWNALSLIDADGAFLTPLGGETVLDVFHAGDFLKQDWQRMGAVHGATGFAEPYFRALEQHVDVAVIRDAKLTVLIDPVGGAGCGYLEAFAKTLGFKLVPINAQPSGYLAREAEPRPRSALQMASFITPLKGDVGFVLSSDMGRMSLVTEEGEPASEEYTFAVIADHVLGKRKGTIVTNGCTTRTIDDIAAAHQVPVVKTSVGQAFVVSALMDEQGVLGGEGSGSAVLPAFSRAFDGFLMMALILEFMAETKQPGAGGDGWAEEAPVADDPGPAALSHREEADRVRLAPGLPRAGAAEGTPGRSARRQDRLHRRHPRGLGRRLGARPGVPDRTVDPGDLGSEGPGRCGAPRGRGRAGRGDGSLASADFGMWSAE
jgi:phosphomannomutase